MSIEDDKERVLEVIAQVQKVPSQIVQEVVNHEWTFAVNHFPEGRIRAIFDKASSMPILTGDIKDMDGMNISASLKMIHKVIKKSDRPRR